MKSTAETISTEPLSPQELEWLKKLRKRIWNSSLPVEEQRLTDAEWEEIKDLVNAHALPVTIVGSMFGHIKLVIYNHGGAPGLTAEPLITIEDEMIPELGKVSPTGGICRERVYDFMTRLTNTPQNLGMLNCYGINPPEPRGRYHY